MGPKRTQLLKDRPGDDTPVNMEYAMQCLRRCRARTRELVHLLGQRQYLDSQQLVRLFFGQDDQGQERWSSLHEVMQGLAKKRIVYARRQIWTPGLGEKRPPNVWFLDWNGMYGFKGLWPQESLSWDERIMGQEARMKHILASSEAFVLACETAANPKNNLARVAWLNEWNLAFRTNQDELDQDERARRGELFRPDGLLALRFAPEPVGYALPYLAVEQFVGERYGEKDYEVAYRLPAAPETWKTMFAWIEADRGTESPLVHTDKAKKYREALLNAPGTWQKRFERFGIVLVITDSSPGDRRAKKLVEAWKPFALAPEDRTNRDKANTRRPVAVTTWEAAAEAGLLGPIWWSTNRPEPTTLQALIEVPHVDK